MARQRQRRVAPPFGGLGATSYRRHRVDVSLELHFHKDAPGLGDGEFIPAAAVDVQASSSAPGGECIRVDMRLDNNESLPDVFLSALLSLILPSEEGTRKLVAVYKYGP